MDETEVPIVSSFEDVYPTDARDVQRQRWDQVLARFEQEYGTKADFVSRSPGRVNIIGEHIDYSLYECLPMAVTVDVLLAVSVSDTQSSPRMRIANLDPEKFPSREFTLPPDDSVEIDTTSHHWSNYFKAGLRGATELLKKKSSGKPMVSMDVLVHGTVPAGGGLSSSAAFVCASALAVMRANGVLNIDKTELTQLAIVSERAVGVNSGGMDQSASVLALKDSALLVSFKPKLEAKAITFPEKGPPLVFVIAQSLVVSNKQVTAPIHYNLRVVECTLAALVLAKVFRLKKPLPADDGPLGVSLRGFHDAYFEQEDNITDNTKTSTVDFRLQLDRLIQLTEDYLIQDDGYTREDVALLLEISTDELHEKYLTKVPVRADRFMIRQRALHVFSEALRVQQFVELLTGEEAGQNLPARLGEILNAVQKSCRELYECSCPELDEICAIAISAGAYGSRLTGAGWGGCSVHLVPEDKVDAVRQAWIEQYYNKRYPNLTPQELEDAIVVSRPGRGSLLYNVQ